MKKDLLLFAAFIFGVATTAGAAKNKAGERIDTLKARQLQEVQVISTRASKKAPLAFTNVSKKRYSGCQLWQGHSLPVGTHSFYHSYLGCR